MCMQYSKQKKRLIQAKVANIQCALPLHLNNKRNLVLLNVMVMEAYCLCSYHCLTISCQNDYCGLLYYKQSLSTYILILIIAKIIRKKMSGRPRKVSKCDEMFLGVWSLRGWKTFSKDLAPHLGIHWDAKLIFLQSEEC